jgi:hypothetical protein
LPDATIAAFALILPSREFKVAVVGCGWPVGHTVKYDNVPMGTTAIFNE